MKHTFIQGPVVLVVLDGWGIRTEKTHNAIVRAHKPNYDRILATYAHTQIEASGEAVGLPVGQMGNSEVGHTIIGAGYVLYQDLVRIRQSVEDGKLAENEAFAQVFKHVKKRKSKLHILGLLSCGGVHAHEDHIFALIQTAQQEGIDQIIVHPFLDGIDSPPTSGIASLKKLETYVLKHTNIHIGSLCGRYYAMDRDTNWDRTSKVSQAIFEGIAEHVYDHTILPSQIIQERYHQQIYDTYLEPIVFRSKEGSVFEVSDGDGVIFTNFRKDRAKQLSRKVIEHIQDKDVCFVTMTNFGSEIDAYVAFDKKSVETPFTSVIAQAGLRQAHIAETEKFAHATYFLNGGRQEPFTGEEDILIPSRKDIKTHDLAPQMRAREICAAAIQQLKTSDFVFINFANADMVAHMAKEAAIVKAVETIDEQLGILEREVLKADGCLLITSDHGNAEMNVDPDTGAPHTSHTTNPVPFIVVHKTLRPTLTKVGGLKDIAPTILSLLTLPIPPAMTGHSLILK